MLTFPENPNELQIYDNGIRRWQWNGASWVSLGFSISEAELFYWRCMALMLDPNALSLAKGISGVVPEDEYWVVIHAWHTKFAGSSNYQYIRQVFPGSLPLILPPGTEYDASYSTGPGNEGCFTFYILGAGIIMSNSGYTSDPKGLYHSRAFEAYSSPQIPVTLAISDNSVQTATIPVTGGYYVTSSSVQDCAWMGFWDGLQTSLTLLPERSDADPFRFASPNLIALQNTMYPAFSARGANVNGGTASCTVAQIGD